MEHNDDIEQLLQQYGRQQQLASHVRHLAHVQARRRTWVVCTLLMLLGTAGTVRLLVSSEELEQPLVAQHLHPIVDNTALPLEMPSAEIHTKPAIVRSSVNLRHADSSLFIGKRQDSTALATSSSSDSGFLPDSVSLVTNPFPEIEEGNLHKAVTEEYATLLPTPTQQSSRFHFFSSVTASVMPFYGTNDSEGYSGPNNPSTNDHSSFSPRFALAADLGVAATVAGNERRHLDIGISVGGHYHQGELLNETLSELMGVDGSLSEITFQTEDTYNTFSLYACLPLTFSVAPRDNQSIGWSLSLTPAHSLVSTQMLGKLEQLELNPWRLTFGVGILFPKGFPRSVSLIANLLPLYTSQPIHEIGIEIGF